MNLTKLLHLIFLFGLYLAITPMVSADPVVGQVDTFQKGSLDNWHVGEDARMGGLPVNIATGGPSGSGDGFMLLTSLGGVGPSSRLSVMNNSQWAGNYLAAGINAIQMDLNNQGSTDLYLRLLLAGPFGPMGPENVAFNANAIFLPAGSGWQRVTFLINPNNLVGFGSINGALANAQELRLFHNPNPAFGGPENGPPAINAKLGVDNIRAAAVPEPAAMLLLGTGLAALAGMIKKKR